MKRSQDIFALTLLLAVACLTASCSSPERYTASGDAFVKAKRFPEAIIQYRNAIEKDPSYAPAMQKLADAYMAVQDGSSAAEMYVKAADLLPKDTEAQLKAAGVLLLARQFDLARLRTQNILRDDPKNVSAQVIHANAMAGLKQYDRAKTEIERAISLDPLRSSTYSN